MKIVYIAHPIGAPTKEGIEANLQDLYRIIRKINLLHEDVVPFAPYVADILAMDDNVPAERERGIANDTAILKSGMIEEVWLTGDRISNGMRAEWGLATELGIPVTSLIGKL